MTKGTRASLVWRSSRRCESGLCVEVAFTDEAHVRDGKQRADGPLLSFGRPPWQAFVAAIKAGEFDRR